MPILQFFCFFVLALRMNDLSLSVYAVVRAHSNTDHNPMLCQLSYDHHVAFNFSKAGAKVLLFLDKCKSKSDFFIILIGNLAQIRSVIWRNYVRQFGIIPFGKMAHFRWDIWLQIFKLHKNSYNLERKSKKILHISQNCCIFAIEIT